MTHEPASPSPDDGPLLAVDDLEVHYPVTRGFLRREVGRVRAVDGVSFEVRRGETLGLVGESGCGKTTTALAALGLEDPTGGEVRFDGRRVTELSGERRSAFHRRAQLVVQDPNDAFNPRMTVGEAVAEPLAVHGLDDGDERREVAVDLLERVGLSSADADRHPHELSGGEKQRVAIARALVLDPDLIVADEPTSALDGRVQSEVLGLLADIRREFSVSILFISHDIDLIRRFCDRVVVMYLGELAEKGPIDAVLGSPSHPYTRLLMGSVPSLDPGASEFPEPLTDTVPDPADPPTGCRFHTRCPEHIPPAGTDLPRSSWRSVAAFRFAVQAGELPGAIDAAGEAVDEERVREAFDLPASIEEDAVETGVAKAVSALADGDRDRASDILEAAIPTVCERESPADTSVDGCAVRCHRYDPAIDAEPTSC
ncbi:MAG: ABC transporter ATP-binding protein [Halobacteriales archaeon]